jgi:DNA-binding NarL/FixJ family response regulator
MNITVVLADAHPVVRSGLRAMLASAPDIRLVAEAATVHDALREATLHQPDVLVLDGIAAASQVRRSVPSTGILVLAAAPDRQSLLAAIQVGVRGYLHKETDQDGIVRAIRGVAAGDVVFGSHVADEVTDLVGSGRAGTPFPELTPREREVLELIAAGLTNSAIARHLQLARKTVSNHLSAISGKLQVADRSEAVTRAREVGLGRLRVVN